MTMVSKQENDFRAKLKKVSHKSDERAKQVSSNDVGQDAEIAVDINSHATASFGREDFLKQLR